MAATVFLLLQACLGLEINGQKGWITLSHPVLPEFPQEVRIRNLTVGDGSVDLLLQRHPHDVSSRTLRKEGRVEIVLRK